MARNAGRFFGKRDFSAKRFSSAKALVANGVIATTEIRVSHFAFLIQALVRYFGRKTSMLCLARRSFVSRLLLLSIVISTAGQAMADTLYEQPLFNFSETSNIVYGTGLVQNGASSENLTLDVYRPTQIARPCFHNTPGDGADLRRRIRFRDKADMASLAEEYATLGYVVVSINYRIITICRRIRRPARPITSRLTATGIRYLPRSATGRQCDQRGGARRRDRHDVLPPMPRR